MRSPTIPASIPISEPRRHSGPVGALGLSVQLLAEAQRLERPEQCVELEQISGRLAEIEPTAIEGDQARIAFWLNLYNALVLHRLCAEPVTGSVLRHPRMFSQAAYDVGGHSYSLNLIENGLLRLNRRPPYRLRRPLRGSDPRLGAAPGELDPRVHFALNCGARSCPPIRAYEPERLEEQLELATRAYLEAETEVSTRECRITLPRLLRLYRADFGSRQDQIAFAACYLDPVAVCAQTCGSRLRVSYSRFDWTAA